MMAYKRRKGAPVQEGMKKGQRGRLVKGPEREGERRGDTSPQEARSGDCTPSQVG